MVRYHINDVNDDMVLGESILLPSGKMLLAAGQKLQVHYCERLKELGYNNLLIQVEGTESVLPQSTISERAINDMNFALEDTNTELVNAFQEFKETSLSKIKVFIKENRQHLTNFIMSTGLTKALHQFIDEITSQPAVVLNLSALQQTKPGLYSHALNVAITALTIGRKYKYSYEELKQLGIGALNYDLGLIALPRELLDKPVSLFSEEEKKLYEQHPLFGYILLTENPAIPATSAACALQHHEREDGSGFPRGLKGDNRPPLKDFSRKGVIHRFAEIVMIADYYTMLCTGRTFEGIEKMSTQAAIKMLVGLSGNRLNGDIIKSLLSIVPLYPVGARIRILNAPTQQLTGYYGVVARDNPHNLENPQIILYETRRKQKIKPILIDTSKHAGFVLELNI